MKKVFIEYIAQMILIVFSVVLGLYLNQKMVDYNQKQEAQKILSIIYSEVKDNRELMLDWSPYHQEINDNFKKLLKDEKFTKGFIQDKTTLFDVLMTRRTFMTQPLSDDAWEIAKANPIISNISFEERLLLSKIYNQQKSTFEPASKFFDVYHTKGVNTVEDAQENLEILQNFMNELAGRELLLMQYYDEAFKRFELDKLKE